MKKIHAGLYSNEKLTVVETLTLNTMLKRNREIKNMFPKENYEWREIYLVSKKESIEMKTIVSIMSTQLFNLVRLTNRILKKGE